MNKRGDMSEQPNLNRVEIKAVCVLNVVHEASGCCNHHIRALSELSLLHLQRHACEHMTS
jgi:hypothetical protein